MSHEIGDTIKYGIAGFMRTLSIGWEAVFPLSVCYKSPRIFREGEIVRHTLLVETWVRDERSVRGGISAERFLELDRLYE